jgi:hypothetical protein
MWDLSTLKRLNDERSLHLLRRAARKKEQSQNKKEEKLGIRNSGRPLARPKENESR